MVLVYRRFSATKLRSSSSRSENDRLSSERLELSAFFLSLTNSGDIAKSFQILLESIAQLVVRRKKNSRPCAWLFLQSLIPLEVAAGLVLGDASFKKVFLFA